MMRVIVPGKPVPQPRARSRVVQTAGKRGFAQHYTPARHPVQAYKAAIALAWQQAGGTVLSGALHVTLTFAFPRSKAITWKTRPMPRLPHTAKPDLDNLAKAVLDALTGHAWVDDSQITQLSLSKHIVSGAEQAETIVVVQSDPE